MRGAVDTHAYALLQRKTSEVVFTLEADSKSLYKSSIEVVPQTNKDLKLKLDLSNNPKIGDVKGTLSLDHSLEQFRYKVAMSEGPVFKFSAVTGRPGLGLGFELGFDWLKGAVSAYDGVLYWSGKDAKAAVKYVSHPAAGLRGGDWVVSGYKALSSKVNLAFKATKTAQNAHLGEAGVQVTLGPGRILSAKLHSDGVLSCASRQRLWQCGSLLYACQLTRKEGSVALLRAGFKLKINS